jgi:hypothetical protein
LPPANLMPYKIELWVTSLVKYTPTATVPVSTHIYTAFRKAHNSEHRVSCPGQCLGVGGWADVAKYRLVGDRE